MSAPTDTPPCRVLLQLEPVTETESEPSSLDFVQTWEPNRTLYQSTLRKLYSIPFEVSWKEIKSDSSSMLIP